MKTQTFKTTINCSNCIRAVSGFLNEVEDIEHWEVDTDHPDKILSVKGDANLEVIVEAVEEAGFVIQPIESPASFEKK